MYDIAIIGGGIHGAGVAQAASAAGYSVVLLEQNEIGSGTSSRSSKLIHGGLRYLESGHISLVKECLKDRSKLITLAPDLVKLIPFYIPVYKKSKRSPFKVWAGLTLYALLSKLGSGSSFSRIQADKWENPDQIMANDLVSVFRYFDAQTDDLALTRAVMHSARSMGADILSSAQVLNVKLDDNQCAITFRLNGQDLALDSHFLINATGPWVNQTLQAITPEPDITPIDLVQGTHIVVNRSQLLGAYYLESPTDGRAVFSIPWRNKTLIGTTEVVYNGDPAKTEPGRDEINYLMSIYNHYFPSRSIDDTNILESFSGLRVLPKKSGAVFSRSRETILTTFPEKNPRLLSIYGGKLTSYRSTAEKIINRIRNLLPGRETIADPEKIMLYPLNTDM